jgi:hypothetical protein
MGGLGFAGHDRRDHTRTCVAGSVGEAALRPPPGRFGGPRPARSARLPSRATGPFCLFRGEDAFAHRPGPDAPFEARRHYYRLQAAASAAARHYRERLLPDVLDRLREGVGRRRPGWGPTHLVKVLGLAPDLVCLTAGALGLRHVLGLYTAGGGPGRPEEVPRQAEELLAPRGGAVTAAPIGEGGTSTW